MRKKKYIAPVFHTTHIALGQHLLLSSGVEIGIPHGAKSTSVFEEEIESNE